MIPSARQAPTLPADDRTTVVRRDSTVKTNPLQAPRRARLLLLAGLALAPGAQATYVTETADLRMIAILTAQANNGRAVSTLGDINGDGFLDVGIGTPGENPGGLAAGAGAISIFIGDATADRPGPASILRDYGEQAGEAYGASIVGVGDLNGDGFDDYAVGAPTWDNGAAIDVGRVFVYFGSATVFPNQAAELRGTQANSQFGAAIAGAGDLNGDGYADLVVGAPRYDDAGRVDSGQVQFFFGGPGNTFGTVAAATTAPTAAGSLFGSSLASAGDFNGDGFADLIVGVPNATVGQTGEGAALLYLGSNGPFDTVADLAFESNQIGAGLGAAVAGAGDVNGDGFSDIALGAPLYDNGQTNEGAVFVFHGSASPNNTVDLVIERDIAGAGLGQAVAFGDNNGDLYADLAIGAPLATDYGIAEFGKVFVATGSANGLGADAYAIRGQSSTTTAGRFGSALAFVDYNGNGVAELFVGAPEESGGASRPAQGFSYLVRTALRLSTQIDTTIDGTQASAQFGYALAQGDINGDGLDDLAVGVPLYDGVSADFGRVELYYGTTSGFGATPNAVLSGAVAAAQFGRAVAIGDFNGDGFGDVAVGAPESSSNGGAVFVYHGSAGAFDTTVDRALSLAQVGARYGDVVTSAGDLNGDGFVELAIGAPLADIGSSDIGVAYVYAGSASGIGAAPLFEIRGGGLDERLGRSIAAAGDVNGDGFADLAVGARGGGVNTGSVRIYFGGIAVDNVADQFINGGVSGGRCSEGLSGAGDIDGDGYSDLIYGCPGETANVTNGGSVRLLRGSSAGLITTPATQIFGTSSGTDFGRVVQGGGDLNGDGRADVLIGEPFASSGGNTVNGALHWVPGGATGLVASAMATITVPETNAQLGAAARLADVDGDGVADVLAAAPGLAGSAAAVGAVHVVHVNGEGRSIGAQQFRSPTTPLDFNGLTQTVSTLLVVASAPSATGRERARLQVQLCPKAVPFGHVNCIDTISSSWNDVGTLPEGSLQVTQPNTLVGGETYSWRARTVYAPFSVTQSGIVAPTNPAKVSPWRRMRARADVLDARTLSDDLFANGFE